MNRRHLLAALCAAPFMRATAAPEGAIVTVGVLTLGVSGRSPHLEALRQGLREHGYVDGKNARFEYRFAEGHADRLAPMAAQLVELKVRLIVTESAPAALAASRATKSIPIVMAVVSDPVAAGFAASLARPGGNLTGLTLAGAERSAKQVEVLKQCLPAATSMAIIYAPRATIGTDLEEARSTGRALGIALQF
jgi:putative tryptophan/tyrosine transport system substrate-binding protein